VQEGDARRHGMNDTRARRRRLVQVIGKNAPGRSRWLQEEAEP